MSHDQLPPDEHDEALGETFDLDEWEVQAPPSDFAERVLGRLRAENAEKTVTRLDDRALLGKATRVRGWAFAAAATAACAMLVAKAVLPPATGEAMAAERVEVSIGSRARAVLEPGAQVKWNGDDVEQARGNVFYRVEPGARFRVRTPSGEVEVKGTCFTVDVRDEGSAMKTRDLKVAAVSATTFVAVYEGKVAVSHANEHIELKAGEHARAAADGISRSPTATTGDDAHANKEEKEPLALANENLVEQVTSYKQRLEAIDGQKQVLEKKLATAEAQLAGDGGSTKTKSDFDLSKEDWAELAKTGNLAYKVPCQREKSWAPSAEHLADLGLSPDDGPALRDAFVRNNEWVWSQIGGLCARALGGNATLAEKLGPDTCQHLIFDVENAMDKEAARKAMTEVAEIRAGLRPMPGPNDKVNPVLRMMLVLTGANSEFEKDLAKSFGLDEAHRLAFAPEMCSSDNRWGGRKKK